MPSEKVVGLRHRTLDTNSAAAGRALSGLAKERRLNFPQTRGRRRLGVHRKDLFDLCFRKPELEPSKTDARPLAALAQLMEAPQRDAHLLRQLDIGDQLQCVTPIAGKLRADRCPTGAVSTC